MCLLQLFESSEKSPYSFPEMIENKTEDQVTVTPTCLAFHAAHGGPTASGQLAPSSPQLGLKMGVEDPSVYFSHGCLSLYVMTLLHTSYPLYILLHPQMGRVPWQGHALCFTSPDPAIHRCQMYLKKE